MARPPAVSARVGRASQERDAGIIHVGNRLGGARRGAGGLRCDHHGRRPSQRFGDRASAGVCVGMWNMRFAWNRKSRGIRVSTAVCQSQVRVFRPVDQPVKGQAGEDAAGGDGGGEIGFARAPFAGGDAVEDGHHKPDAVDRQSFKVELVNWRRAAATTVIIVCRRNHCRNSPSAWPGTNGLMLAVTVLSIHMPLVAC